MTNPDESAAPAAHADATTNADKPLFGIALAEILALLDRQDPAKYKGDEIPEGMKVNVHIVGVASEEMIRLASLRDWLREEHNTLVDKIVKDGIRDIVDRLVKKDVAENPGLTEGRRSARKLRAMHNFVNNWIKLEAIAVCPELADKRVIVLDKERNIAWADVDAEAERDNDSDDGGGVKVTVEEHVIVMGGLDGGSRRGGMSAADIEELLDIVRPRKPSEGKQRPRGLFGRLFD